MAELDRQLRFTPQETLREHARRAEAWLAEIDPRSSYPEDFVVFRVTGYRPRGTAGGEGELPATLVGAAVLEDVSSFITRATERAPLDPEAESRDPVAPMQLAAEIGVSDRTLRRWRRRGLVFHHVGSVAVAPAVMCFRDAWDRFAARHPGVVERAAAFRPGTTAECEHTARAVADARPGVGSRSNAHATVAAATGRSPSTVRSAALRHDLAAGTDLGRPRRPDTGRAERLATRACGLGVAVPRVAARLGRSPAAVRRLVRAHRVRRLTELDLDGIVLPTFERADAADVLLGSVAATTGLGDLPPIERPLDMLAAWRATGTGPRFGTTPRTAAADRATLDALAAARAFLRWRARHMVTTLDPNAAAAVIDAVETDLRWTVLLGRRIAGLVLPATIPPIEQALGGPLHRQPADTVGFWLAAAIEVATDVGLSHNPRGDAAAVRRAGWAMGRRLAADGAVARDDGRAGARHPDRLDLGLRWRGLEPPLTFLERSEDDRHAMSRLPEDDRIVLALHEGLPTAADEPVAPPRSMNELAQERGVTVAAISRRLREAGDRLLAIRRARPLSP